MFEKIKEAIAQRVASILLEKVSIQAVTLDPKKEYILILPESVFTLEDISEIFGGVDANIRIVLSDKATFLEN